MADITYDNVATLRRPGITVPNAGEAYNLKCLTSVVEAAVNTAAGATLKFMRIPSNARISHFSRVFFDDLDTTGATLDLGLASVNANITSDPDAFSNAHDVTGADLSGEPLLDLFEKSGDYAWDFVNGQTTDPGGELDVYGSLVDAGNDAAGTIMVELYIYFD